MVFAKGRTMSDDNFGSDDFDTGLQTWKTGPVRLRSNLFNQFLQGWLK